MWANTLSLIALTLYLALAIAEFDAQALSQVESQVDVVEKDVAIIGGGAAGTYAAVRLSQDLNTTIELIEQQARLGVHVETYTVPETNTTLEHGVQFYVRDGLAVNFVERFGLDITQ
ncbi:hypothetical protein K491DRAFT_714231 [Lophiostoma macrostomum CBS 122681]|uniref:Uncharacterized protein n=1 Tax=Lophiostoma macrostomum CBS 122681 TaxID=1314788 RepID=A0A6A6TFK1_9PLEO|nr:hypothetical protein K491DRAFT_714231 [Lophiostoma macrostomum CBS 122681]